MALSTIKRYGLHLFLHPWPLTRAFVVYFLLPSKTHHQNVFLFSQLGPLPKFISEHPATVFSVIWPQSLGPSILLNLSNLTKSHWYFLWNVSPVHPFLSYFYSFYSGAARHHLLCSPLTGALCQAIPWPILFGAYRSVFCAAAVGQRALLTEWPSDPDFQGSLWFTHNFKLSASGYQHNVLTRSLLWCPSKRWGQ